MYDLIIIGSGYGGAAVAARTAALGNVLLLERGRRWRSGDFPTTLSGIARCRHSEKNPLGLWGMRFGQGTGNAYVSAFGGASVVNYGITVKPPAQSFENWPIGARELDPYFERALSVLQPVPNPQATLLADWQAWEALGLSHARQLIANTIDWSRCRQCGHCVPGCNDDAKRSLDQTYLRAAELAGAAVQTETCVDTIIRNEDGRFVVNVYRTDRPQDASQLHARRIVMAAGTFGTLELLQRCKGQFGVSPQFGRRMGMNGDGVAFLYNTSVSFDTQHGAPISSCVQLPFVDPSGRARLLTVMAGRIPGSLCNSLAKVLAVGSGLIAEQHYESLGSAEPMQRLLRRWRDLRGADPSKDALSHSGLAHSALAHSMMFKLDGQDQSNGVVAFDAQGAASIDWPDYCDDPMFVFGHRVLTQWAEKIGGGLIPHLGSWRGVPGMGVHPLGGCRMADSMDQGVVDTWGRIFRPTGGVYPNVWIADASIIADSLGVPPSLTVAALAERVAENVILDLTRSRSVS